MRAWEPSLLLAFLEDFLGAIFDYAEESLGGIGHFIGYVVGFILEFLVLDLALFRSHFHIGFNLAHHLFGAFYNNTCESISSPNASICTWG